MAGLIVWEDMYNYDEGVYEYTTGNMIGGHAMRIVGWGHDETEHLYWIAQNQWTNNWGMDGYVNIKAGQTNVGLDNWTLSCMPDVDYKSD